MTEQRMTEQNGHEEHERNSTRDGDAGFAALDATEPHFGPSALGSSALGDAVFSAPISFEPAISFEPIAPPVEVCGFEALSFEAPAPLAEPTLSWETPQTTPPAHLEPAPPMPQAVEPPYTDEPSYSDEPPISGRPSLP